MRLTFIFICILLKSVYAQNNDENERLLKNLNSTKDTAKVNVLNTLAGNLTRSEPIKALSYANDALKQSKSLNYKQGEARASKILGAINWISGNYNHALAYLKIASALYLELDDQTEIGNIYILFGLVYWHKGEYKLAEYNYSEALTIYKNKNDTSALTQKNAIRYRRRLGGNYL